MDWYVYIVRCKDDTFYTGITTNIFERVYNHNHTQSGAKYTRSRRPVTLVYQEGKFTKQEALKREIEIKRMSRNQKKNLINN